MVVLRPAVEVTGSIWSGSDERAPARSCPTAEELELIELRDHTSERDIRLCCSPVAGTCSCMKLPEILGEGVEKQDARLLSVGNGW